MFILLELHTYERNFVCRSRLSVTFFRQRLRRSTLPLSPSRSNKITSPRTHYRKNLKFIMLPHLLSIWSRIDGSLQPRYDGRNAVPARESKSRRAARVELLETRPRTVAAPRGVTPASVLSNQSGNCSSVSPRLSEISRMLRDVAQKASTLRRYFTSHISLYLTEANAGLDRNFYSFSLVHSLRRF